MKSRPLAAVLLALLVACSNGPPTAPVRIPLVNVPTGVVTLRFEKATSRVGVRLDIYGLIPNGVYTLDIHRGTCLKPTRDVLVTFEQVKADAAGDAKGEILATSPTPAGIPTGAYIDLRASGSGSPTSACTDIRRRTPTAPLALFAPPTHKPFGSVTARYRDGGTLEVNVGVMGLDGLSTHAVDLRSGPCASRGSSVEGLGSLTADSIGTATLSRVVHVARDPNGFHVDVYSDPGLVQLCADVAAYPAKR